MLASPWLRPRSVRLHDKSPHNVQVLSEEVLWISGDELAQTQLNIEPKAAEILSGEAGRRVRAQGKTGIEILKYIQTQTDTGIPVRTEMDTREKTGMDLCRHRQQIRVYHIVQTSRQNALYKIEGGIARYPYTGDSSPYLC